MTRPSHDGGVESASTKEIVCDIVLSRFVPITCLSDGGCVEARLSPYFENKRKQDVSKIDIFNFSTAVGVSLGKINCFKTNASWIIAAIIQARLMECHSNLSILNWLILKQDMTPYLLCFHGSGGFIERKAIIVWVQFQIARCIQPAFVHQSRRKKYYWLRTQMQGGRSAFAKYKIQ